MFGAKKRIKHKRKGIKPLQIMRPAKEKPNAGKVYPAQTKEEKHSPQETKEIIPISKLRELIGKLGIQQLKYIAENDDRVTARELAKKELIRREG